MVEQEQRGTARANYGDELIKQLHGDLSPQFGRGFGVVNLGQMKRVFLTWPDKKIFQTESEQSLKSQSISSMRDSAPEVPALSDQFPWSAYIRLLTVKSPDARNGSFQE